MKERINCQHHIYTINNHLLNTNHARMCILQIFSQFLKSSTCREYHVVEKLSYSFSDTFYKVKTVISSLETSAEAFENTLEDQRQTLENAIQS